MAEGKSVMTLISLTGLQFAVFASPSSTSLFDNKLPGRPGGVMSELHRHYTAARAPWPTYTKGLLTLENIIKVHKDMLLVYVFTT